MNNELDLVSSSSWIFADFETDSDLNTVVFFAETGTLPLRCFTSLDLDFGVSFKTRLLIDIALSVFKSWVLMGQREASPARLLDAPVFFGNDFDFFTVKSSSSDFIILVTDDVFRDDEIFE